jgi:ATP-dependent helicase/nuclease subunit A
MVLTKHPDGEPLREPADIELQEVKLPKDTSSWRISILNRQHIVTEEKEKASQKKEIREKLENFQLDQCTPYKERIDTILDWGYSHERATTIPSKLSVTQIKKSSIATMDSINYNIPNLVKRPKFMEKAKVFTGAERGTILHFVLQHLNFREAQQHSNIQEQIQMMVVKELLTEEESETLNIFKIEGLLESELGKRMLKADKIYKETAFNIKKKAKDVIDGLEDCDEALLVQGIIDCYFEEDGKWVLVDYKSDYVPQNDVSIIIKKYGIQLQLYKEALEKITGKDVKESYLYLLDIDMAVKL